MPIPNKTISATDAGVYLPGTKVRCIHRPRDIGVCVVPSTVALEAQHHDSDIYVCWPNGDAEWVEESFVKRIEQATSWDREQWDREPSHGQYSNPRR